MFNKLICRTLLYLLSLIALPVWGQANKDLYKYQLEFGIAGGGAFYLGDVNATLFKNLGPAAGGYLNYKFSGHHELGAHFYGGLAGIETRLDDLSYTDFLDISVMYTFNFWNFGANKYEENASNITPYAFWGLGVTLYDLQVHSLAVNVPFGLGVKYKFGGRWNVGIAWTMHKLLADNFDQVNDPYLLNKGVFNNKDWFSTVSLSLSVDFLRICAPCRNGITNTRKK